MSSNKENNPTINRSLSTRKSVSSLKKPLNQYDTPNSTELTNEFAGYLDYVRKLEAENENLKSEKETIISSCNTEIIDIKSTYGCEIDALRKAVDELTKEKCTANYLNDKLLEENNSLKIKFARKIDAINDLEVKFELAEANLIKNRRAMENFESISEENGELSRKLSLLNEQLKCEINNRTEAENRLLTLKDEVEFLRKVNTSTINREINNAAINNNNNSNNSKIEAFYSEKFDKSIKEMRDELIEEFDEYKQQIETTFTGKLDELSIMNGKLNEKCQKIYSDKKSLQNETDSLRNLIGDLESKIAAMEARESRHGEVIEKLNREHEEFVGDMVEENRGLRERLQQLTAEMATLLNEKIANEKEAYIFRSMLKGEQSRFSLSDSVASPKRRKVQEEQEEDCEITAWAKSNIKIICYCNNNGNYLELINDSEKEVNLNEWKIEISTSAGVELLYTFPPRILSSGRSLKVWSLGQEGVLEDDENLIMNLSMPSLEVMTCKLSDDMDEVEASFELSKQLPSLFSTKKRKILKAKKTENNKENCSIM